MTGRYVIKRVIDIVLGTILIIVLLPLMMVISILVVLDSKGPVFFSQERAGQFGVPFRIIKYRTMVPGAESIGPGLDTFPGDSRITGVGRVLRNWSLDELPQLFNILKGDMSIVGPRPVPVIQTEEYTARQRRRFDMKPGITGLAQVSGRNLLSWSQKIEYDLEYIENWNLLLDLKILVKTIIIVVRHEGIY